MSSLATVTSSSDSVCYRSDGAEQNSLLRPQSRRLLVNDFLIPYEAFFVEET